MTTYGDEELAAFADLASITADPPYMREKCSSCCRPILVCWCPFLPHEKIQIKSKLFVLQHPSEVKKCLRTAPILEKSLESKHFKILRGKRFPGKHNMLQSIFDTTNTLLLYPAADAVPVEDLDLSIQYNIIIIDGTWPQAKAMYNGNKSLQNLRKVVINAEGTSNYVIRTQPNDKCLSTVESAAIALSVLENNTAIKSILLQPLHAICRFQLNHGAVPHHSRQFRKEQCNNHQNSESDSKS